jgi:hypothetical protein
MSDHFGPRASILDVGVCEELPGGVWYVTGWRFETRNDPRVMDRRCPFVHDDEECHVGFLGWLWTDLKALSDAHMELAMLDCTDSPPNGRSWPL